MSRILSTQHTGLWTSLAGKGVVCLAAAVAFLAGAGLLCAGEAPAAPPAGLAALIATLPEADNQGRDGRFTGPDLETMKKIYDEITKGGKQNVAALVGMLVEPGKGEDYKTRYVLHGLVTYANRTENEEIRPMVREALLSTLGGATPKAVQKYVLEELKHIGSKAEAEQISRCLADDDLCEFAAQTLVAIRDTADLFGKALPAAGGKNKVTIIQALGVLRDVKAADELKKALSDAETSVRLAAAEALANIGEGSAANAILTAADGAKDFERIKLTEAALRLADRLLESDKKADAERIFRKLWDTRTAREERQVRCAAVQGLVSARGEMADILAAMKTNDPQIRAVAIRAAMTLLGDDGTPKLVAALAKAAPTDRAALLGILGARRDPAALPTILDFFKDPDQEVRIAAMQAASAIGGADPAGSVLALLAKASGKELEAAAEALSVMRGNEANALVGAAVKQSTDAAIRSALLGVLAARRAEDQADAALVALADNNKAVRLAALKALGVIAGDAQVPAMVKLFKETTDKEEEFPAAESALTGTATRKGDGCAKHLSAALEGAPPDRAAGLIRALGAAGTRKALDTVVEQTKNANAEVKDVAVHVLAEWREKSAAAPLLELAQGTDNQAHRTLALRGVIRLLDRDMKEDEKLMALEVILKAAKNPEEKRMALAKLQEIPSLRSFELVTPCVNDEAVKEEAGMALVRIADRVVSINAEAKRNALQNVAKAKDDPAKEEAAKNQVKAAEELAKSNAEALRDTLEKAAKATTNKDVRNNAERILGQIKKQ